MDNNLKKGMVYGYGPSLCRKIINDNGDYRYFMGRLYMRGPIRAADPIDYEFAGIKLLGKENAPMKILFTGKPFTPIV